MKKKIFTLILTVALTTMSTTTFATEIPRESTPLNATEKQTQIVENLFLMMYRREISVTH